MRKAVLAAALVLIPTALSAGEPSPVGQPEGMKAGEVFRYYLWCDEDTSVWHLRTTTAGKSKTGQKAFTGTVKATGGAITSVSAVRLEDKGERKDFWEIKDSGRELRFDLQTATGLDGFDFKLGKGVTDVEFDLKIDGKTKGDHVFVGKAAEAMNQAKFSFRLANLTPTKTANTGLTGKWVGKWNNSNGDAKNNSVLELDESEKGTFRGLWDETWIVKDGTRTGNKLAWSSTYQGKTCDVAGELKEGGAVLSLTYSVTFKEKGKTVKHTGEATYTRK